MSEVEFARPWLLAGLVLVPVAFACWLSGVRRARSRMRAISREPACPPPYLSALLFAGAAMLALVAAALPRWGVTQSHLPRNGADLFIVLDISRSMDARDVPPSRLEAAKAALAQTLARMGGDRAGLVVFAGSSVVRFPLTTDLAAADQVIASLESSTILIQGGTNAALGLDVAVGAFDARDSGGRAVLLLTDGDDLGGDPAASAERFRRSGIDLLVAGVGTAAGSTVPVLDPRTQKPVEKLDASGQPIITKLNETFLRAVAAAAGGRYLGSDLSVVPGLVAGRLETLKSAQVDARATTIPIERYQWFALGAFALVVFASAAEWFSRRGLRFGAVTVALASTLLFGGCATSAYSANEAGRDALRRGDAVLAIDKFIEAQAARPDDAQVSLNLAAAFHAAGRYDEAILAARRVAGSPAAADRARAFASIGHHAFAARQLETALDAFHRSLLEEPANETTRHDYEVVRRLLKPDEASPPESPQADPSTTPGDAAGGGSGEGTQPQTPGASPQPSSATATPGAGPPQPGPGASRDLASIDRELRDLDAQVARLVRDAGGSPTATEALEILRLLAERARIAAQRDGGASINPRDY